MEPTRKPIDKEYLTSSFQEFNSAVLEQKYLQSDDEQLHTHANQEILNNLGLSDDGTLLFNGNEIGSSNSSTAGKSAYEIAQENGFEGTESEWLESLKGMDGTDGTDGEKGEKGDKGDTPYIGENGNWWYGDEDSGIPIPSFLDLLKYVDTNHGIQDTPIGHILTHMGKTAPRHYLICDGSTYQISDYPYLTQHFINEFGSVNYFGGDGETTFAVPDLRGEFLRGYGINSHTNQGNGAAVGEHQNATTTVGIIYDGNKALVIHGAPMNESKNIGASNNADTVIKSGVGGAYWNNTKPYNYNGDTIYTSRPTNTSVLYCIKYEPTYFINLQNVTN